LIDYCLRCVSLALRKTLLKLHYLCIACVLIVGSALALGVAMWGERPISHIVMGIIGITVIFALSCLGRDAPDHSR